MSQRKHYAAIIECLVTATRHKATTADIYKAVRESGAHGQIVQEQGAAETQDDWKHAVRNAMQFLKRKGVIRYLRDGVWGLGEADWPPWVSGLASEPDEDGQGDAMADREPAAASDGEAQSVSGETTRAPGVSAPADSPVLAMPIVDALIPTRLKRRLIKYGARSLGDVRDVDEERFARIAGVGQKTIADLHDLQAAVMRGEVGIAAEEVAAGAGTAGPAKVTKVEGELSLESPIHRLVIPTRLLNRLVDYGCATVGDVMRVDTGEFADQRGVGKTTLAKLRNLRAWIRAHVPDARDVPIEEEQRRKLRLAANRTLRAAAQSPDGEIPADGLVAVTQFAPGEGPIASLADLVREVVERTVRCRSVRDVERNSAIWLAHYGVPAGKPKTLEALARKHSLSRERVRQIIAAITRLAKPLLRIDERYAPQLRAVREAFASCLGVGRLKDMLALLERAAGWEAPPTYEHLVALCVLLEGTPDAFAYEKDTDLIRHSRACAGLWDGLGSRVQGALDDAGEGQHVLDFAYSLGQRVEACLCPGCDGQDLPIACCGARNGQVRLPDVYVRALLSTLDPCPLYGDMVLGADWGTLRFGRLKMEVVGAALRIIGKPVHYSELAEFVRKHSRRWRHADDRNIHACLTGTEEFVPTEARGTYGLQEWDVRTYRTVADRVEDFLRQRGRPAPMWKIIEVLTGQRVPENNVRACFGQHRFRTHSDGTVGLSEWRDAGEQLPVAEHSLAGIFLDDGEDEFIMG